MLDPRPNRDRRTWRQRVDADMRSGFVELRERYRAARRGNRRYLVTCLAHHPEQLPSAQRHALMRELSGGADA